MAGQKQMVEQVLQELEKVRLEVERAVRLINLKADIKDVCALVDVKANTDDVFKVFDEIRRSVDLLNSKITGLEQSKNFDNLLNEQKLKNLAMTNS